MRYTLSALLLTLAGPLLSCSSGSGPNPDDDSVPLMGGSIQPQGCGDFSVPDQLQVIDRKVGA